MKHGIRSMFFGFAFLAVLILLASCQEQTPPGVDLGTNNAIDSSYVASVESKQDKVILIEELTGVQCPNCPIAATTIKSMSDANPGRILSVAMHAPVGGGFTEPIPTKSKYDFRVDAIDEIITLLGGMPGLPSGAFNRQRQPNGEILVIAPATWVARVNPLLSETTPVNVQLESNYTADNNSGELLVKIALTENVTDDIFLTAYVIENDIEDYQDNKGDKILYTHDHVFRKILTSVSGSSLNFADKTAGTVLQKRIKFEANITGDNAWNLDNCKIIAFVHKSGADQSILQAAEVKLK